MRHPRGQVTHEAGDNDPIRLGFAAQPRRELQVVRHLGEVERAAGERDRDVREQGGAGGVLGGDHERQEQAFDRLKVSYDK